MLKPYRALCVCGLSAALFSATLKPSDAFLDKTRFATDIGVAFFSFHHFVWAPYHAGSFARTTPHHDKALFKAGVALLFAYNRLKAADHLAHVSKSPMLNKLAGSLDHMQSAFSSVGTNLKAHKFNPVEIMGLNKTVDLVGATALKSGLKLKDVPIHIPGV